MLLALTAKGTVRANVDPTSLAGAIYLNGV